MTVSVQTSAARVTLVAALLLSGTGCYSTWDIPLTELNKLDGYRAPTAKVIVDTSGDKVQVDQRTELQFVPVPAIPDFQAKFNALDVHVGPHQWWLSGILHEDGNPIRVDLNRVSKVVARRYSHGKTAGLVAGTVAGAAAVAIGITIGVVIASFAHEGD